MKSIKNKFIQPDNGIAARRTCTPCKKNRKTFLQPDKGVASLRTCPSCKTKRSFRPYLDGKTNKPINNKVGKCNREIECGYHFTPKQFKSVNKNYYKTLHIVHNGHFTSKRPLNQQRYPKNKNYSMEFDYKPHCLELYTVLESHHTCPSCGEHSFSVYRSAYNNSELNDRVGKCDRVKECGYHLTPKRYFYSLKKRY